jgi:preprotein translocase subunit SecG
MLFTIFSVFYVLIAAAMIVLILMQRGDGANAGASFGGGASGTVFGARGAASFLTRTTGALATIFFLLSVGMGMYLSHHGVAPSPKQTLGVMAGAASSAPAASASSAGVPAASAPAASASAKHSEVPAVASTHAMNPEVPTVPAKSSVPATSAPKGSAKVPASSGGGH